MTTTPVPDGLLESASDAARDPGRAPAPGRRLLVGWMLALLPVSVVVALLVLVAMAASGAAATGGCGGG